jgi:predicted transposase/invertase (TIGR01784 family)
MKSDFNEKELLFEVGYLTNKARFESDFVKDQVKSILLILGLKFIKDKEELKNFGDIMMESSHLLSFVKRTSGDLIEEGRKEGKSIGIGEGVELGRKDGIISVAKRMLMRGMDIDVISELTGLSIEEINSLKEK